jgi:hypothetical protein
MTTNSRYKTLQSKPLDELDVRIILLIWLGVNSCTHISYFLSRSKQTISDRVDRLERQAYVARLDSNIKHYYRTYELLPVTEQALLKILPSGIDFQMFLLTLKKAGTFAGQLEKNNY